MNKKIIKSMFDKKINKDEIYKEVIKRVDGKREFKLGYIIKISVVPICAIIVMIVSLSMSPTKSPIHKVSNNSAKSNIININNLDNINQSSYALDIALMGDITHPSYKDLIQEFPWISNFKIPYNYNFSSIKHVYNYEGIYYKAYYLDYYNDNSSISIYFSDNSSRRPRCINVVEDSLEDSIIDEVSVKLIKYSNNYYAFFKVNELNFDIEIRNITEKEFINLIESIIYSTKAN